MVAKCIQGKHRLIKHCSFLCITELRQSWICWWSVCIIFNKFCFSSIVDEGHLYVWGGNKHGQLVSKEIFLAEPRKLETHFFSDEKIGAVWSGWTHLVAQTGRISKKRLHMAPTQYMVFIACTRCSFSLTLLHAEFHGSSCYLLSMITDILWLLSLKYYYCT